MAARETDFEALLDEATCAGLASLNASAQASKRLEAALAAVESAADDQGVQRLARLARGLAALLAEREAELDAIARLVDEGLKGTGN